MAAGDDLRPGAEQFRGMITAHRFVLWWQDHGEWLAAGGRPEDEPPCPVTESELPGLAAPLATLVIGTTRELAGRELFTDDPAEQDRGARERLQRQVEGLEVSATFADVEAEMQGGPSPV